MQGTEYNVTSQLSLGLNEAVKLLIRLHEKMDSLTDPQKWNQNVLSSEEPILYIKFIFIYIYSLLLIFSRIANKAFFIHVNR